MWILKGAAFIREQCYLRPNVYQRKYDIQHISQLEGLQICCICCFFPRNFLKIFRTAFSKNTTGGPLLILCDCSRTPFNPLTPGGNKSS